jgi:hypothetical protein
MYDHIYDINEIMSQQNDGSYNGEKCFGHLDNTKYVFPLNLVFYIFIYKIFLLSYFAYYKFI